MRLRRDRRRRLSPPRAENGGGGVRKLAVFGGITALAVLAWRRLRRPPEWEASPLGMSEPPSTAWETQPASPEAWEREPASAAVEPAGAAAPPEPKPASEADQTDREIESRLDDETKYDRLREQEEAARHEAAERLRNDPITESAGDDAGTSHPERP